MKTVLVFILAISFVSFSTQAQTIKPIKKGETSPITGYVIDKEFEKERRKERELLQVERNKNKVWQELGKIREGREDFYKKQAVEAKREALKSDFQKVLYFVGGVLLGGAAVYVGSKVTR